MYLDAFFKDLTVEKLPISVYLMIVGRTYVGGEMRPSPYEWTFGFVLKRGSGTEYKRLGIFEFSAESSRRDDLDWLESGEVQTVIIV